MNSIDSTLLNFSDGVDVVFLVRVRHLSGRDGFAAGKSAFGRFGSGMGQRDLGFTVHRGAQRFGPAAGFSPMSQY